DPEKTTVRELLREATRQLEKLGHDLAIQALEAETAESKLKEQIADQEKKMNALQKQLEESRLNIESKDERILQSNQYIAEIKKKMETLKVENARLKGILDDNDIQY
ncbi:MAG: hypothetical protein ACYTFG_07760, partial [Planctomycetota bacterium]